MQKKLFIKIAVVLFLALVLNIPLGMVRGLVSERMARQDEVAANIAASYADPQRIAGPLLVLPYIEEYTERAAENNGQPVRKRLRRALYLSPKELSATGKIATDVKTRGLFRVPVYTLDSSWQGRFDVPANLEVPRHGSDSSLQWSRPFISLAVADARGFAGTPLLTVGGKKLDIRQGTEVDFMPQGAHADLEGFAPGQEKSLPFTLALKLRGTGSVKVLPLAENLKMDLSSDWPHPGFEGRFLPTPEGQHVGADGFRAHWEISSLAADGPARFARAAENPASCGDGKCLDFFEVRLVEPVNIYLQSERALKYGFLFIGVTFAAFFLFEVLKSLAIHPAQYTLVGLAQAMFFLLLLSLSEHLPFVIAYAIAAAACVVLVGHYLGHVMRSAWRGAGFATFLGAFYAALYGLLVSEDNALLMGSLLLFALLAAAMVATRRFDWYRLTPAPESASDTLES